MVFRVSAPIALRTGGDTYILKRTALSKLLSSDVLLLNSLWSLAARFVKRRPISPRCLGEEDEWATIVSDELAAWASIATDATQYAAPPNILSASKICPNLTGAGWPQHCHPGRPTTYIAAHTHGLAPSPKSMNGLHGDSMGFCHVAACEPSMHVGDRV